MKQIKAQESVAQSFLRGLYNDTPYRRLKEQENQNNNAQQKDSSKKQLEGGCFGHTNDTLSHPPTR